MQSLIDEIISVVLRKIVEKLNHSLNPTFNNNAAQNPGTVSHGSLRKICNLLGHQHTTVIEINNLAKADKRASNHLGRAIRVTQ